MRSHPSSHHARRQIYCKLINQLFLKSLYSFPSNGPWTSCPKKFDLFCFFPLNFSPFQFSSHPCHLLSGRQATWSSAGSRSRPCVLLQTDPHARTPRAITSLLHQALQSDSLPPALTQPGANYRVKATPHHGAFRSVLLSLCNIYISFCPLQPQDFRLLISHGMWLLLQGKRVWMALFCSLSGPFVKLSPVPHPTLPRWLTPHDKLRRREQPTICANV